MALRPDKRYKVPTKGGGPLGRLDVSQPFPIEVPVEGGQYVLSYKESNDHVAYWYVWKRV